MGIYAEVKKETNRHSACAAKFFDLVPRLPNIKPTRSLLMCNLSSSFGCRPAVPGCSPDHQSPIANNAADGIPDAIVCKVHVIEVQVLSVAPDFL